MLQLCFDEIAVTKFTIVAFLSASLAFAGACSHGQRITVDSLERWPTVDPVAAPASSVLSVTTATVRASESTFVHSLPDWSDRNLADRDYILAGADERPAFWIAYLRFELTGLDPAMFGLRDAGEVDPADSEQCSSPDFKVSMSMVPLIDPPLRGRDSNSEFRIYRALAPMQISEITWNNQPRVADGLSGSGTVAREEVSRDEFDVTEIICDSIERGQSEVVLAIIPFDPSRDLRRRWATASEYDPSRLPSLNIRANGSPGAADSSGQPGHVAPPPASYYHRHPRSYP